MNSSLTFFHFPSMTFLDKIDVVVAIILSPPLHPSVPPNPLSHSHCSVFAFHALSTEHIWSLEALLCDAHWPNLYNLSNMCGAIDTTLVHLRNNPNSNTNPNFYHCCYGYPSLLLQVMSNHKKIFWDVCVKTPNNTDDPMHFRDYLLCNCLTSGDVVWDKVISGHNHHVCPYVVGD